MKKIKVLLKNKKVIIPIIILLIISGIMLGLVLTKNNKQEKRLEEKTYTMYVKINPLVKIEFKENYYICTEKKEEKVCSDKTNIITNYKLINDDAKEIYKDINLKGLSLIDALVKIYDTARDKKLDFDTIEIVANYKFNSKSLTNEIEGKSKYDVEFNVITLYDKKLNEKDIISGMENQKYYNVSFNSDGGSKVEDIKVASGYGFSEPNIPTKEGYTFVEWQLDGKKYNFEDGVTKDIILKAKWEEKQQGSKKEESTTTTKNIDTTTKKKESTTNNSNKINLNDNISVSKITESTGTPECFFYMFATNLKTLFPEADIKGTNSFAATYWPGTSENREPTEISEEMLSKNINAININMSKENNLINILSKYKNGKYKGISNVKYTLTNHRIFYSYDYLVSNNSSYKIDGSSINKEVESALIGSTLFMGPCGGFDYEEDVVLTESLCNQFNLECSRW